MKNFRIKEVKNGRTNSMGNKASLFIPQVSRLIGFRDIKPSEMKGDKYKGKVIGFAQLDNAFRFIAEYKAEKNIKTPVAKAKKVKVTNVVFHEVR